MQIGEVTEEQISEAGREFRRQE